MIEKKYIRYLILSLIIVITCTVVLNYIVDPLLYYKRADRIFPVLYSEELKYQIPGLIKNFPDHNTAIIGTSMAGIFLASEVSSALNEKTIKLTSPGATLREQSYVLSRYLKTHPDAKTIIWVADPMIFDNDPELFTIRPYSYPFFLYDNSNVNLKYLLSYKVTVHSLQTIANYLFGIGFYMKTSNLDELHTLPLNTPSGCNRVIENYTQLSTKDFKVQDPIIVPLPVFNRINAAANLNRILELAETNKDVQFYVFLPPYSIVRYLFEDENNGLERLLEARNFIADKTKGTGNIKIIDWQADEDIITNLDLYTDMIHHVKTINDRIIRNIIDGNFDGYESVLANTEKLRSIVRRYDFEKIKKCEL